jgi:hypothetical protein
MYVDVYALRLLKFEWCANYYTLHNITFQLKLNRAYTFPNEILPVEFQLFRPEHDRLYPLRTMHPSAESGVHMTFRPAIVRRNASLICKITRCTSLCWAYR